jgi:hypothetical protein
MAIWYILWSFGNFFPFWHVVLEKSGNPDADNPELFLVERTNCEVSFVQYLYLALPCLREARKSQLLLRYGHSERIRKIKEIKGTAVMLHCCDAALL